MVDKTTKAAVRGALKGTALVPLIVLFSHIGRMGTKDILWTDYSLKNRFVSAYNPWANWETRSYGVVPYMDNMYNLDCRYKQEYGTTPDGMLALHLIFALIGWNGAEEDARKKQRQIIAIQKTK